MEGPLQARMDQARGWNKTGGQGDAAGTPEKI